MQATPRLTLESAPVGTQAPSIEGGAWCKTGQGRWKWNGPFGTGGTFPRPGGDWDGRLLVPLAKLPRRAASQPPEADHSGDANEMVGAPVRLPEPDINTANHAGLRVIGYTSETVSHLLAEYEQALQFLAGLHQCPTIDGPPMALAELIFDAVQAEQRNLKEEIAKKERNLDSMRQYLAKRAHSTQEQSNVTP